MKSCKIYSFLILLYGFHNFLLSFTYDFEGFCGKYLHYFTFSLVQFGHKFKAVNICTYSHKNTNFTAVNFGKLTNFFRR